MKVAGVDGCPAGWLMITYDSGTFYHQIYSGFKKLLSTNHTVDRILVDMPIGLASPGYPRTIDQKLRWQLPGRGSTVFNVPVRDAIYASQFDEARHINKQMTGKSLSIQSLYLMEKIKQIDTYLINTPKKALKIYESHPELCFKSLNNGKTLLSKKSSIEGQRQRLRILGNYESSIKDLYQNILSSTTRKRVRRDDIIDAICLCLVNKLAIHDELKFLSDENAKDEHGIEIKIAY